MDFEKLLKPIDCACGKTHTCDIKKVVIKPGAVEELADIALLRSVGEGSAFDKSGFHKAGSGGEIPG